MKIATRLLGLTLLLLAPLTFASAPVDAATASSQMGTPADEAKLIAMQLPSYPLMTCVVSDELLGGELGEPIDVLHEGRLVRLCCKSCKRELEQDPAAVMARVDAAILATQGPGYPLTTCPISGKSLGAMGDPINHIVGTRLVRLCCAGCVKAVTKSPAAALAKINVALIEAQLEAYPLTTCPVSGKPLGALGDPIDFLYGTRLLRLCCRSCMKSVSEDPQAALAKLDAALAAQTAK